MLISPQDCAEHKIHTGKQFQARRIKGGQPLHLLNRAAGRLIIALPVSNSCTKPENRIQWMNSKFLHKLSRRTGVASNSADVGIEPRLRGGGWIAILGHIGC